MADMGQSIQVAASPPRADNAPMRTCSLVGLGMVAFAACGVACGSDGGGTGGGTNDGSDGGAHPGDGGAGKTNDGGAGDTDGGSNDGKDGGSGKDGGMVGPTFGAPIGTANSYFGIVLAMSADGNTIAVGSPHETSSSTGIDGDQTNSNAISSGAVFVFTRAGAGFTLQAYVKASNTMGTGLFGTGVALSADGDTMLVGAPGDRSNAKGIGGNQADTSAFYSGAAFVFARSGSTWSQKAYIKASNSYAGLRLGATVALSGDGATAVVGTIEDRSSATGINGNQSDMSLNATAGAAYVFTSSGGTWSQQAYVKPSNTVNAMSFATSAALSSDGNTMAIGATGEGSNATGVNGDQSNQSLNYAGATYVFTRSGVTWTQQAYVKASNTRDTAFFGRTVSLSGDGNTLAVGANGETCNATGVNGNQADTSLVNAGAAYVFARSGATWSQQAYLKASDTATNADFGKGMAISTSGDTLLVGAPNLTGMQGAVYPFTRAAGSWTTKPRMLSGMAQQPARFGLAIGLSADGTKIAIGSPDATYGGLIRVGIVETF